MGSGPLKERLQVAVWSQGLLPTLGAGSLGHPRTKSTHLPSPPAKPSWALARGRRCGSLSRHPASSQNPKLPRHMGASSARAQASQQLSCSRHMGDAARNISCLPPMNPRAAAVVPSLALFSPSLQHFSVLLRVSIPSPSTPPPPPLPLQAGVRPLEARSIPLSPRLSFKGGLRAGCVGMRTAATMSSGRVEIYQAEK